MLKKIALLFAFSLFCIQSASAQAPTWIWARNVTGPAQERGESVTADEYGNTYVYGHTSSVIADFGGFTISSNFNTPAYANWDIFLAKYDVAGNLVWVRSASGYGRDGPKGVVADGNGSLYATGFFVGPSIVFGGDTLINRSPDYADIFLAKYDYQGNLHWVKQFSGTNFDAANEICLDGEKKPLITGMFKSDTLIFGSDTLFNHGGNKFDVFIAKFDTAGNVIWARSAGGTGDDNSWDICSAKDGNAYIIGTWNSDTLTIGDTTLLNPWNEWNTFFAKYDQYGNVMWARKIHSALNDEFNNICTDLQDNVYISGPFADSTIAFGPFLLVNTYVPEHGIFFVKYDNTGNVIWADKPGYGDVEITDMAPDKYSNIYTTGRWSGGSITFGSTMLFGNAPDYNDLFVVKNDSAGTALWAISAIGSGWEMPMGMNVDSNGRVTITGDFSKDVTFGNTILLHPQVYNLPWDLFVAKIDVITGNSEDLNSLFSLRVFPNPGDGHVSIQSTDKIESLSLTNALGQQIFATSPGCNNFSFFIENKGLFYLRMMIGGRIVSRKIIVM